MENHPVSHKEMYPLRLAEEEGIKRAFSEKGKGQASEDTESLLSPPVLFPGNDKVDLLFLQRLDVARRSKGEESFLCLRALMKEEALARDINAYGVEAVFLSLLEAQKPAKEKRNSQVLSLRQGPEQVSGQEAERGLPVPKTGQISGQEAEASASLSRKAEQSSARGPEGISASKSDQLSVRKYEEIAAQKTEKNQGTDQGRETRREQVQISGQKSDIQGFDIGFARQKEDGIFPVVQTSETRSERLSFGEENELSSAVQISGTGTACSANRETNGISPVVQTYDLENVKKARNGADTGDFSAQAVFLNEAVLMSSWKLIHRLWHLSFFIDEGAVLDEAEAFLLQDSLSFGKERTDAPGLSDSFASLPVAAKFSEASDSSVFTSPSCAVGMPSAVQSSSVPASVISSVSAMFQGKKVYRCLASFKSFVKKAEERLKKEGRGVPLSVFSAARVFMPFLTAYIEKKRGKLFPDIKSVLSYLPNEKKWIVQINGRKKAVLFLPFNLKKEEVQKQILSNALIQNKLSDRKIKKAVVVDGREKGLVNFVV